MRIDMANFTIRMSRPHIAACSVEYERTKFEDYLRITPGRWISPVRRLCNWNVFVLLDGLRHTREWLHRNRKEAPQSSTSPTDVSDVRIISSVLVDSFMELLNWDESYSWPEVSLDYL